MPGGRRLGGGLGLTGMQARVLMPGPGVGHGRILGVAVVPGEPTARREPAGAADARQLRRRAGNHGELSRRVEFERWHGLEQRLGVTVPWVGEQRDCVRLLDDLAPVHHRDPVGMASDNAHIVGNQHDRHRQPRSQGVDQLENLRLDRHVERSGRLISDQQLGLAQQADGDHRALTHPARKLVRKVVEPLLRPRHPD